MYRKNEDSFRALRKRIQRAAPVAVFTLGAIACTTAATAQFTERASEAGVLFTQAADPTIPYGGGIVWADFNNDDWPDHFGVQAVGCNRLALNNQDGTFSVVVDAAGADACTTVGRGATAADFDNDGDQDLYLTAQGQNKMFRNELVESGTLSFTDITVAAGMDNDGENNSASAVWGDYDKDGYLDLFVTNHTIGMMPTVCDPNLLWHNNGNGTFTNVAEELGVDLDGVANQAGCGLAATWSDYDNDGDQDLMVINDLAPDNVPNRLFRNDGPSGNSWSLTDVSAASGFDYVMFGMGIAKGDIDLDGDFDYYMADIGPNNLALNNGDGTFTDIAGSAGVESSDMGQFGGSGLVSWGPVFVDVNHDGLEDLFVANGGAPESIFPGMFGIDYIDMNPNYAYKANGDLTFDETHVQVGIEDDGYHRNVTYVDYDRDGDPDIHYGVHDGANRLYRNELVRGTNWLQVEAIGTVGNRDAVGARIYVETGQRSQLREVDGGSTMLSLSSRIVHFGLGGVEELDLIRTTFLSGAVFEQRHVPAQQFLTVVEPVLLITPEMDLVTVPQGGELSLLLGIENLSGNVETQEIWFDFISLDAGLTKTIRGPLSFSMQPGGALTPTLRFPLPNVVQPGSYELAIRTGSYPDDIDGQIYVDVIVE